MKPWDQVLFVVKAGGYPDGGGLDSDPERDGEGYFVGYTVSADPDRTGWRTDGGHTSYCIDKEHAQLFAAAPELYRMLQMAADCIEAFGSGGVTEGKVVAQARKLLAKARGEAT